MDFNKILEEAFELKASDIHVMVKDIFFRIDGELIKVKDITIAESQEIARHLYGKEMDGNDLDFSYSAKGIGRFRVNLSKQRGTYCATLRCINSEIPNYKEMGVPQPVIDMCTKKKGMFLVTGPTGCGKSTTQAMMVDYINENFNKKIVTLENPIEYLHSNKQSLIVQREIGEDTNFQGGLRAVLRQDPDVILIGELRDKETMETALSASETGHLVFATLHTIDAVSTINRIIDFFPPEQRTQIQSQLAENLIGVFSQNLIPSTKGGRILGYELLTINTPIKNQINSGKTNLIKQTMATTNGCKTIDKHLEELSRKGLITKEQVNELIRKE